MSDSTETVKRAFKHDWYQTEATVVVTVLIKNVQQDKLKINFNETNLGVNVQLDDGENYDLEYHLRHKIVPEQCSYKITPSKVRLVGDRENIKEQESKEKPEGEDAVNKLFQEIYGKGSDEVKKAMNKSYLESGGTVLSTNWDEIKKDKVPVKPPDGMEWKKWD
ncbi:protein sgt1 [Holotrichia oblita]|uniref:Protein sgt1 n=1 Tax=Holotrichia oblita TaxID=644536 RepID=A0ACB9SH13_HOLOL|nr:protein sgt1 [Holotrichia oblita]